MASCWHTRWGLSCGASEADVRAMVKDTFTLFKRDILRNNEQVRQLGLDYQWYVHNKHPKCCNGCVVAETHMEEPASEGLDVAPPPPPEQVAAPSVEPSSMPPQKRRKGKTAASTVTITRAVPADETSVATVLASMAIITEDRTFRHVDLTTTTPEFVIRPVRTNSFYQSLHNNDPNAFPLSTTSFSNRRDLYDYGLKNVHNNDTSVWGFNRVQVQWYGRHAMTNQRFICALIINEIHEPRFGHFFCLSRDFVELDTAPVPCFMNCNGYGCIRYCGTWTFQRVRESTDAFIYVVKSRPRNVIYKMTLTSYDDRWGTNVQM